MEERRILSNMRHSAADVARVNFSTVRKNGLDPLEVRAYLDSVAREMTQFEARIRDLQEQLVEERRRAANPTIDESTLMAALGSQSAAILRSAHEEAGRVTAEAQERSAAVFSEAQKRAADHLIETQERVTVMLTEAEHAASQLESDARSGADRLIETAKVNGDSLVERGREQGRAIVEQANEARRSILNDLAVRRKAVTLQIEQLRAARDTLATFVQGVRDEADTLLAAITNSDEQARQAALEALRLAKPVAEPTEEEIMAAAPLRTIPESPISLMPKASSVTLLPPESTSPIETQATRATSRDAAEEFVEDNPDATDVVNEIFARLRKATLEERGATPVVAKKSIAAKPETADGELFARRDAALDEPLAGLTRKVKRALQDDQNVTLERLRDVRGPITNELEDELIQRARYASAAIESLADAANAGVRFAQSETGSTASALDQMAINDCAADLAVTIVLALRKRFVADGNGEATERANAAYKEWRGARVERLCTDAARRAFHIGVTATAVGGSVRFVAAPNDAPCDACALDAAAPPRSGGQAFPSGSLYPPLHAGCACTVVPV